ncbi:MAG: ATPase [Fulvivirga sp.]
MTSHSKNGCHSEQIEGSLDKTFPSSKFIFTEVTAYLQKFGQQTYGQHFKIIEEDFETIYKLFVYFYQDERLAEKLNIKLHKGILLTGPIGCGKTTLMNLLKHIHPPHKQLVMVPTRKIAFEFAEHGIKTIHKYTTQSFKSHGSEVIPRAYCFDDLGVETSLPHFGNKLNIMAEILLSRYDIFIAHQMLSHFTTNLSALEVEELYGNRVRSRLREMANLITFKSSVDKRS